MVSLLFHILCAEYALAVSLLLASWVIDYVQTSRSKGSPSSQGRER